jgi:hypothetical protein
LADYFTFRYDSDNVMWLLYDGLDTASIYWPTPDIDVYTSGRTNYNSSRIGDLDDTGAFISSDRLCFQASDLGAPGIQRQLTIDSNGNLQLYSLVNATGGWTVSWVARNQPCSVHGLCGKNAVCEYQPSLRCSCIPPPLEEAPVVASRRRGHDPWPCRCSDPIAHAGDAVPPHEHVL